MRLGTGHDSALWPVLLLLLIVLVPSAGVVWMMRAAMENERLAVRQRLADAYHAQLEIAHRRIDEHWRDTLDATRRDCSQGTAAQAFAESVRTGARRQRDHPRRKWTSGISYVRGDAIASSARSDRRLEQGGTP